MLGTVPRTEESMVAGERVRVGVSGYGLGARGVYLPASAGLAAATAI
jgi:hypothetical protein